LPAKSPHLATGVRRRLPFDVAASIREEALLILQGRGAILDTAREISEVLRAHQIEGAIIGGIAVVLHGHVRTTVDVDVYTPHAERLAAALGEKGFVFDQAQRRFVKAGVPVDLVTIDQIGVPPGRYEDREGILTVSLADLINIKLRSGTTDPLRAQDLADVINLIEANHLTADFAPKVRKELRPEFRTLLRALERRRRDQGAAGG
jgi:hypothetical protein